MPAGRRPVAVVAGGSAGVGRAAVRCFAESGYDVAVLARGRAGVDGAVADVERLGGRGLGIPTDVADLGQVREAVEHVEADLGEIDVWVNNAFVDRSSLFWDLDPEDFWRMTEVTYGGQVNGMHAALEVMRPRDRGVIVNVSSSLAHRGIPLQSAYSGAKHAVKGLTDAVRAELLATGSAVKVCLVTLPGLNTPQFDWSADEGEVHPTAVPPIYQPEVAGRAIVELAQNPRRDAWVGLPTVWTILGNRLAPDLVDWFLGRYGISAQQDSSRATTHGSNVHEARDHGDDRGARGSYDGHAFEHDVVAFLSRTVGRTVFGAIAAGLAGVGAALDRFA